MAGLPPYSALAGSDPSVLRGAMSRYGEPVTESSYEFPWERDRALVDAVDRALREVLEGRAVANGGRPRWLDGLARRELASASQAFWSGERFARVRLLERLGLVDLEPDDVYVLAMISSLGPDKAEKLRSDRELVERALWRVFEVEGGGEVSLTNVDRFGGEEWRTAFLALTADGTLDRARVLAGCLDALGRDFAAYRAGWFATTYLALEPTVDELDASQPALRRLLGAPVPATVGLSVKQLLRLQKAGRLEPEATLASLTPATMVKAKGTALGALRLARDAGRAHEAAAIEIARTALGHPHPDVQRAAADLLANQDDGDSLVASADDLTPSVRQDLGLDIARGRLATAADGAGSLTQPLFPVPGHVTTADLAERTAALLEDAADVGELEAVLAALAVPGTEEGLAPLRKRARSVVARGPRTDQGDAWLPGQVARLVLTLTGEQVAPADPDVPALRFVVRRMAELRRGRGPLLATPDLPGGWVSPTALVDRLARTPQPRHHDLVAALLRLHPEGRAEVGTNDLPAAVRFALDGTRPTGGRSSGRGQDPEAWWVAAARSRGPYDSATSPLVEGGTWVSVSNEHGRERRSSYAEFVVSTSTHQRAADDAPTELETRRWATSSVHRPWLLGADWVPSLASIWPHDAEHFLALVGLSVLEAPTWPEVRHEVPQVLDSLARHPGRMGALAAHTLAAGLSAAKRDYRLHAVDAFLDLVPTGRIAASEVAAVLARCAEAWPASRWTEGLRSAARAPGGSGAVLDLLTALLPALRTDHRGLRGLLDLLRDETLSHDRRVTDPALLAWLGRHQGSSATARTARLLLR